MILAALAFLLAAPIATMATGRRHPGRFTHCPCGTIYAGHGCPKCH